MWRSPLRRELGMELTVHGRRHRSSRIRTSAIPGNRGSARREGAIPRSHRAGRVCRLMRCAGRCDVRGRASCRDLFRAGPMSCREMHRAAKCVVAAAPRCVREHPHAHWLQHRWRDSALGKSDDAVPPAPVDGPLHGSRDGRGVLRLLRGSESGVVRHAEAPALCCAATTPRSAQRGEREWLCGSRRCGWARSCVRVASQCRSSSARERESTEVTSL